MAKRLHIISVRGLRDEWTFEVYADPKYLDEWRADGLEIHPVENSVPAWVVTAGLGRPWGFLQSLFYFRRPGR